ncbi:MAG: ABC transporter ATP-binding protein [Chloroherpetonaceae bacterium]|nr:ABC transporter ATP-binding protein [Chloroherpetonaceae bacterium]MCS7211846.1 ABC transporter ATP-binding protein [Chloroherpetonaceae bacterium]MDW8020238.1 ABC transporter ATP-binding protein [Chloroherpetonaceae bacterium]MDW8464730.1 ABC transporter ATP-binding protein [Chloroherpetonaceae bacterium]
MSTVLSAQHLTKTYRSGQGELTVLNRVSFELQAGDTCAIVGPSGSGKTTLLGICAGLDHPTSGTVTLCGILLNSLSEDERAKVRNQYVGFVFQSFQLIPTLTALENVMVPAELSRERHARQAALELLERVGLGHRLSHYPAQLSGGEQQRVAIARSFINRPKILFADEPTGNLDAETSHTIEQLLFELNRDYGTTLVIVTHNLELAQKTQRIIRLKGGCVVSDQLVAPTQSAIDEIRS